MSDQEPGTRKVSGPPERRPLRTAAPTAGGGASSLMKGLRPAFTETTPEDDALAEPAMTATPIAAAATEGEDLERTEDSAPVEQPQTAAISEPARREASALATAAIRFAQPVAPIAAAAKQPEPNPKAQISFVLPADLRDRARAAYRVTQYAEGHPSWREFLITTLEREVQRLEQTYNGGEQWDGGEIPLPGGRKLGS